jgi:hypothetical protein
MWVRGVFGVKEAYLKCNHNKLTAHLPINHLPLIQVNYAEVVFGIAQSFLN